MKKGSVESQTILENSTTLLLAFVYAFQKFPAGKCLINFFECQVNTRPVLLDYLEKSDVKSSKCFIVFYMLYITVATTKS